MMGSWLTSKTCRNSTSDWNARATRKPQRAAASECSEKSVAIRIVRNGTQQIVPLASLLTSTQVDEEVMRKKTRVLLIVSQKTTGEAEYERILAVLRDAGFELHDEREGVQPDVVLLDLPQKPRELPGLLLRAAAASGAFSPSRLRTGRGASAPRWNGPPMIVMSRDAANLPRRARALGAYGFVQRPFQAAQLLERVGSAAEACRRHPTLFGIRPRS
jgi:AmiR/NasT family two-component response regulator